MANLQDFKDNLSRAATGMTKAEALKAGICIQCKKPDPLSRCKTDAGKREYYISGVCEECFDKMFGEDDEEGVSVTELLVALVVLGVIILGIAEISVIAHFIRKFW